MKKASGFQVRQHNEATRMIITGIIASSLSNITASEACALGQEISNLIRRRGYVPQIQSCNILQNGKCV